MRLHWINRLRAVPAELCGNKAATLSRLRLAGISVPSGFALAWSDLKEIFESSLIEPFVPTDQALDRIRTLADSANTTQLAKLLLPALRRLASPGEPLIVRSSSVAEDSERASFAGIFTTVVAEAGSKEVVRAIRQVYTSKWSVSALAYAGALAGRGHPVSLVQEMAVLIQRYTRGVLGGVLFTVDPIGRYKEGRIEISHGGAESVVAGGNIFLSAEYRIESGDFGDLQTSLRLQDVCGGIAPAEEFKRSLALVISRTLSILGPSLDIEWIWDGTTVWVVQARPITAGGLK